MQTTDLEQLAAGIIDRMREKKLKLATAESCTGGLIAGLFTEIAGSSDIFERGFVTYSNEAKAELLDVPSAVLETHGAVSSQTAEAMALGTLAHSHADISVSVTGIAGPGGGSVEKPVGLVYIGSARKGQGSKVQECRFGDIGRRQIRLESCQVALNMILDRVEDH
ncbi:MAG: CinA family protein [Methyloligellaceae bacterium]